MGAPFSAGVRRGEGRREREGVEVDARVEGLPRRKVEALEAPEERGDVGLQGVEDRAGKALSSGPILAFR
jgi:hypothetical protein